VQSATADSHAHVPFVGFHRHARPTTHGPPQVPPCASGCSVQPDGAVVVVVLLVLVVVLLLVVVDDDVLLVVGPKQPQ